MKLLWYDDACAGSDAVGVFEGKGVCRFDFVYVLSVAVIVYRN